MKMIVAFLCAATAFPAMLFERALPRPPVVPPERIAWQADRSWYHNMKNYWTEHVRAGAHADSQWWGKCIAFTGSVLGLAVVSLVVAVVRLAT